MPQNEIIAKRQRADINACNDRCIKSIMRNKLILNTLRRDKFDISRPRGSREIFFVVVQLLQILSPSPSK